MKRLLILLPLLFGCGTRVELPETRVMVITVQEYPHLRQLGYTSWNHTENTRVITLRKYPKCLQHEMRHCI